MQIERKKDRRESKSIICIIIIFVLRIIVRNISNCTEISQFYRMKIIETCLLCLDSNNKKYNSRKHCNIHHHYKYRTNNEWYTKMSNYNIHLQAHRSFYTDILKNSSEIYKFSIKRSLSNENPFTTIVSH